MRLLFDPFPPFSSKISVEPFESQTLVILSTFVVPRPLPLLHDNHKAKVDINPTNCPTTSVCKDFVANFEAALRPLPPSPV